MPGKTKELKIKIKALDRISRTMDRVRKKFPKLTRAVRRASTMFKLFNARTKAFRMGLTKFGGAMQRTGKTLTASLSLPIGLAGAAILRTGYNFQKSINKVGAITRTIIGKNVTPQFKALEKQAMLLGRTTEFSSTQAADAMALLGRAGFNTNEILASTDDVLALASASGMDLAFSADVMAKTMRQFGLQAEDATRIADVLSDVSRRTNVDLETIAETFKMSAPIAKAYGATLEQTAAITGLLGDVGIQGTQAGTALKNIFIKLATPSERAKKILTGLGIAVTTADGKMRSAGTILSELGPKLGKLNKNHQLDAINELFGLRGIAGASALMAKAVKEGKNPIADMTETLKGSTGAAKEMRDIMLRGAPGAMARFQSALEGVGLAFSNSGLLDAFTDLLTMITKFLSWLATLNPTVLKTIAIIGGMVAVIGPLLAAVGYMAVGIANLTVLWAGLTAAGTALAAIVGTISLPFIAIAAAVAGVVAAVIRLIVKWDELKKAFRSGKGLWDSIKKAGSVFFGFGGGKQTEASAAETGAAQGRSVFGPPSGAGRAVSRASAAGTTQTLSATRNAAVAIQLKGFPSGTSAKADVEKGLDFNLGFAGGMQ